MKRRLFFAALVLALLVLAGAGALMGAGRRLRSHSTEPERNISMKNRPLLLPAVLAVALWVAGLVVINSFSDKIPHHPTDAQLLTWIQGNQNPIISGGWLWMMGCLSFLWFAALLRARLAEAEGGRTPTRRWRSRALLRRPSSAS